MEAKGVLVVIAILAGVGVYIEKAKPEWAQTQSEREAAADIAAKTSAIDSAVDDWFAKNCTATVVEPNRTCSLCQDSSFPGTTVPGDTDNAAWSRISAKLGGPEAVVRGVTYCKDL